MTDQTTLAALLADVMRKSDDIAWPMKWYNNPDNFDWVARQLAARLHAAGVRVTGDAGLREAAQAALNELGVPDETYPAPVANAVRILRAALAPLVPCEWCGDPIEPGKPHPWIEHRALELTREGAGPPIYCTGGCDVCRDYALELGVPFIVPTPPDALREAARAVAEYPYQAQPDGMQRLTALRAALATEEKP